MQFQSLLQWMYRWKQLLLLYLSNITKSFNPYCSGCTAGSVIISLPEHEKWMFQSLLQWMYRWKGDGGKWQKGEDGVSILIVVDVPLEVGGIIRYAEDRGQFQSLLQWMYRWKTSRLIRTKWTRCFNPYCSGCTAGSILCCFKLLFQYQFQSLLQWMYRWKSGFFTYNDNSLVFQSLLQWMYRWKYDYLTRTNPFMQFQSLLQWMYRWKSVRLSLCLQICSVSILIVVDVPLEVCYTNF